MLAGIVLATASTLSYGLVEGGAALLAARVAWGVSFAMLRLGSLGYATDGSPGAVGDRLGRSASIAQLGSLFAVTAGGSIAAMFGMRETFIMFGIVSMFAIPIVLVAALTARDGARVRVPGVLDDAEAIRACLREHRALGGN